MAEVLPGVEMFDRVNFRLHDGLQATIPTNFDNVTVVALLDADTARTLIDPYSLHANVYPNLKDKGCPDDPERYNYIKVKLSNGSFTAVGVPWINDTTIEKLASETAQIKVQGINGNDLDRIVQQISAFGYTVIESKMI